jgi:putative transposase
MPRQSRIDITGALHHVIAKGIDHSDIFKDDRDRYSFLTRLETILQETQTPCYAWALIPNHFHLLLRTGEVPLATVMRRLMTGHAISFNNRHERQGHLFQNRYKSILCQDDAYFLELVRYIHLNPMRAGLVKTLDHLDKYPFSGHGVIMDGQGQTWLRSDEVLSFFGGQGESARKKYKNFVARGISQEKRTDLTGGGLVRSAGGWMALNEMRKAGAYLKSDERILGDGEFVNQILSSADERFERKYALRERGINIDFIAAKVASMLGMEVADVWAKGRYRHIVTARSLVCFIAVRELGMTMTSLARRFDISTVAVGKSVERGARIVKENKYEISKLIS